MPEGGEGPGHGVEHVEHLSVDKSQLRRDFQIRKVAHDRGISIEAYSREPAVQALATVIKDTQDLDLNFEHPESTYVEEGEDMGEHTLRQRYYSSERFLRASLAILDEGFPDQMWQHSVYQLGGDLWGALEQYGLSIVKTSEPNVYHNPPEMVHSPPDGAWHDPQAAADLWPPSGNYGWWNSRLDPDDLQEPPPPWSSQPMLPEEKEEWLKRCHEEAGHLGIPPEKLKNPTVIHYLAQLSDARRLLGEQNKCRELISQPEGLPSSVRDRIAAASHLTQAVIMVLEDGVGTKPRLVSADLADELNQATKPYGWQVKPSAEQHRE